VATHIFAAFSPELEASGNDQSPSSVCFESKEKLIADSILAGVNGSHLVDANVASVRDINSWARDPVDAERLWELSEDITGQKFAF
jgi:hypothetical protein